MPFADQYLARQPVSGRIESHPHPDLRFIVIIPCYAEPGLQATLDSLWDCDRPAGAVEVIVVVNSPALSGGRFSKEMSLHEARRTNLQTMAAVRDWISGHDEPSFRTFIIHEPDLPPRFAGPGLARKIGMDEAVFRFNRQDRPGGVILSMDADCRVDSNYFTEIEGHFTREPATRACSICFEHPVSGDEYPSAAYKAIAAYELHLRYYIQAIRNTGFPYAYHTVGSCFGVTAQTYVNQGGMNKRKGGEDFYFLQKIIPLGDFHEINSTCVYPSPRPSGRVPFGTGPIVRKYMDSGEELTTYHLEAFHALRELFEWAEQLYGTDPEAVREHLDSLPSHLGSFIQKEFVQKITEINANSASIDTFRKRFYQWFNMFKILKYLNFVHDKHFSRLPVNEAAVKLLHEMGMPEVNCNIELLKRYRKIEAPRRKRRGAAGWRTTKSIFDPL
jgi:hypothetical protein